MSFKRLALSLALSLGFISAALAQSGVSFGPGQIYGNSTAAARPGKAENVTAILDRALGSTRGALIERGAGGWGLLSPSATARVPYLSGGTGADPIFGAYTLPASITSGGIACFISTSAEGSSVLLTANALVLGGGAGVCPAPMASLGTTTTVLHGNAAGPPTFGSVASADLNITATTCTNQFISAISTGGVGTCSSGVIFEAVSFNAGGSGQTTTGTISASSTSLTLASALDFVNGEGIRINHAGAAFTVNAPTSLIVTPTGTTGATQYVYTIAPLDAFGGVGSAIANTITNTGNATLSSANFNALTWTAPGSGSAPWGYAVYAACPAGCATHSASLTLMAVVQTTSFNDVGFGLITPGPDWIPSAPQGPSLADWLVTTVSSGGGTTTLTLANAATTAATTQLVDHDDTAALQSCITAASNAHTRCHLSGISGGSFPISTTLFISGRMELYGDGIQGTQNYNYANQGSAWLTRASAGNATMIFPNITQGGISATLNDALNIHDFGIFYTSQTPTLGGTTALQVQGTGGAYTVVQTGTLNGTTTVTGLTDTRYMHVQQGLFGTNIPAGTTVTSIDSATQIHISNAATGSGATSLTFDVITGDTLNGSVTNGSTGVTGMTNANFIVPGEVITSATNPSCIPFGTTVTASTSTTVTMSKASTCTNGALPLTFTFGLMTNLRIRGMLLGGADRGMYLGAMTEFWVEQNKFYDNTSYSTILDLNNGNGDWQYGPGNINISGSIFPMSHVWEMSGGSGRIIANKFNTAGSVNSGSTLGLDFNPVRPFTSIEPPTINDNSIEGLNIGIRFFNSCNPTTTCQASQATISGNQMWNNRDIEIDGLLSGAAITGNALGVNGGGGAINMVISGVGVQNIVWTGNIFYNTTGNGSTAISATTCSNCSGSGNKKINNTTLGANALAAFVCGSATTNTNTNQIQFYAGGGTGVTAMLKNGSATLSQVSAPLPNTLVVMDPAETIQFTCTTPPGFGVVQALNP